MSAAIADLERRALASGAVPRPGRRRAAPHARAVAGIDLPLAGDPAPTRPRTRAGLPAPLVPRHRRRGPRRRGRRHRDHGDVRRLQQLSGSALPVFGFVLGLVFVLMLVSFRSPVIALTAVVLNLLSVGAAYGVLTLVFQHGGAPDCWAPTRSAPSVVDAALPVRHPVRPEHGLPRLRGLADREGRDRGLTTGTRSPGSWPTAGVVTSAAVIMVGVFAIFGTLSVMSMKQIGVGLAAAVLIDATVIRGVLLPAVMALLGERNWHTPGWLRWLPKIRLEGARPARAEAAVTR